MRRESKAEEKKCPVCNIKRGDEDFVRPCGLISSSCVWCRRGLRKPD